MVILDLKLHKWRFMITVFSQISASPPNKSLPPNKRGHVAYALILLMDLVHYAIVPKSNPDHHVDLRILIKCRYGIVVSSS